jgi:hypothetical protein
MKALMCHNTVQSHIRLEVIMVVDENKQKIITAVETGESYESEYKIFFEKAI